MLQNSQLLVAPHLGYFTVIFYNQLTKISSSLYGLPSTKLQEGFTLDPPVDYINLMSFFPVPSYDLILFGAVPFSSKVKILPLSVLVCESCFILDFGMTEF